MCKKRKIKGERKKYIPPLSPLKVISTGVERHVTMGGDATTMATHLFACTTVTEAIISDQNTDPKSLKGRVIFAHDDFQ